jgi:hypothetical protein
MSDPTVSDPTVSDSAVSGAATADDAGLVRMINQIAANVAHHPHDRAVAEVVAHLRATWAPAMRAGLDAYVGRGGSDLSPLAADAAELLGAETTRSSPA